MKKLLSILLAITMLLTLAGCQFVKGVYDTDDEVVGGGLVQARDGEETDELEVDDDVDDTVTGNSIPEHIDVDGDYADDDRYVWSIETVEGAIGSYIVRYNPATGERIYYNAETGDLAEVPETHVDTVEEEDDTTAEDIVFDDVENPEEDDAVAEEPIDEDLSQIELGDISEFAPEEGVSFYAFVITVGISADEEGTGDIAVCGLNCNDVNHNGLFSVGISTDTLILNSSGTLTVNDLRRGDIVVITYDGEVMETYPVQISSASRIYVCTRADCLAEIESYLPDGYEDFGDYFPDWNELS